MLDKLVDVLLSVIGWFKFWTIVGPEHAGFMRRWGVPHRDLRTGWNWRMPFYESPTLVDMRLWADVLPAQSLRTADGVDLVIKLMVSHQVADPRRFVIEVFDANNNIQDVAAGALGTAVAKATAAEVYSGAVLRKVRAALTNAAKTWGLRIDKVQIVDCVPAASVRLLGVKEE